MPSPWLRFPREIEYVRSNLSVREPARTNKLGLEFEGKRSIISPLQIFEPHPLKPNNISSSSCKQEEKILEFTTSRRKQSLVTIGIISYRGQEELWRGRDRDSQKFGEL